ncbi:hypothetical protein CKO31_17955 [Thiohalocapsa halophila]|uniref:Uncharacterized protein n=1 Tax=Thiohalocapsa halophila TaxID=69359 RepID=A0ABS1CML9_9GAMM|nr:hypothetical protein [Thiohalocapsa halophila]
MPRLAWIVARRAFRTGPWADLQTPITVDALRGDLPNRYAHLFGDGGFPNLMEEGVHYTNAHYQHANTETIVGHGSLATGPSRPDLRMRDRSPSPPPWERATSAIGSPIRSSCSLTPTRWPRSEPRCHQQAGHRAVPTAHATAQPNRFLSPECGA